MDSDAQAQSVAEIARKLTKAQREAVFKARYRKRDGAWHPEGWYTAGADKRVRRALAGHGLTRDYLRSSYPLTPLGIAVRDHLLSETSK